MANHNATGKKSKKGPELVQRCRGAVLNALDVLEKRGKPISELLAEEFSQNPSKLMELASKFCPRELEAEITHAYRASDLADDELASIAAGSGEGTTDPQGGEEKLH